MRTRFAVWIAAIAIATASCGGRTSTTTRTPTELPSLLAGTVTALARATPPSIPNVFSPPTAAPTATPGFLHFTASGPIDPAIALSGDALEGRSLFVLDIPSGKVSVLTADASWSARIGIDSNPRWTDNERFTLVTPNAEYSVGIDGSVTQIAGEPTRTPTGEPRHGLPSADEAWMLTQEVGSITAEVAPAGSAALYRLDGALDPQWSPSGHTLAFTGNLCQSFDKFLFDPSTRELRNLTSAFDEITLQFIWKRDGSAIAAFVLWKEQRRSIYAFDTTTGAATPLVEMHTYGEMTPLDWSPDGSRLVFAAYNAGRGLCESDATPVPTKLEVISS
jgi:hypothetical protein